jgi:hypothetical protein
MKIPTPRVSLFYGMRTVATPNPDGTWLEPEELCYPHGGMTRRAYVVFPDGVKRVVRCGIPDTLFSIPATVRIKGKTVSGYVTGTETKDFQSSLEFRVRTAEQPRFAQLTGHQF